MIKSIKYFNEDFKNVTKYILSGSTVLIVGFDHLKECEAVKIAKLKKSYFYDIYIQEYGRLKRYGFGIPK
jgi:hypothetical protein